MTSCLAVDIGATKVRVGRVQAAGTVETATQFATASAATGDELFERIVEAVDEIGGVGDTDIACGVGTAGPVLEDGDAVSPLNIGVWRDFPLRSRLQDRLGIATVVGLDGLAIALAEGWVGAAAQSRNFVSLVVSTGVGGGIVLDGRLVHGRTANAGHIGHVPVVVDGAPCVCGGRGCLEAEVSGVAIERRTGRPAAEAPEEVRARCGYLVGRAVGAAANLLDLDLATVSGGVALGFGQVFLDAARAGATETATLPFARTTKIELSTLGADGPLLGAAAFAFEAHHARSPA